MKIRGRRTVGLGWVVVLLALASVVQAVEAPPVAQRVPADAVYALFLTRPDELAANLGALAGRFRFLSPELDLAVQGEKIKAAAGENLLTRQGLEAFGVDVSGTAVLYSTEVQDDRGILLAVPLLDPKLFKDKLFALMEKQAGQPVQRTPKIVAGVEIYSEGSSMLGFSGQWVAFMGQVPEKGKKEATLLAFFGKGKKLATSTAFKQALPGIAAGAQAWVYIDLKQLSVKMEASLKAMVAQMGQMKGLSPQQKTAWRKDMERVRKEQKDLMTTVKFLDSIAVGFNVTQGGVVVESFLAARPAGVTVLKSLFPAVGGPAFHQGLIATSLLGGWFSLDLMGMVKQFGSLPADDGSGQTIKQKLDEANKQMKAAVKLDLYKDLLANFKGPWSVYVLAPGTLAVQKDAPMEAQILAWLRLVGAVRLVDGGRVAGLLKTVAAMPMGEGAPQPQLTEAGNATWLTVNADGVKLAVGVKGDTFFVTLGEGAAESFLQKLADPVWAAGGAGELGIATLNFPNLVETLTGAAAGGLGGDEAAQFRAAWPLAQQVLAKFGNLSSTARMLPAGLQCSMALELR